MNTEKISIRFFDDRKVRAVWDEKNAKWLVPLASCDSLRRTAKGA